MVVAMVDFVEVEVFEEVPDTVDMAAIAAEVDIIEAAVAAEVAVVGVATVGVDAVGMADGDMDGVGDGVQHLALYFGQQHSS